MADFCHLTTSDLLVDQLVPLRVSVNPDQIVFFIGLRGGGGTRLYCSGGTQLDVQESPEQVEEACHLAGLVPVGQSVSSFGNGR